MSTGISVTKQCADLWKEMKLGHKYSYLTFKIQDDKEVIPDNKGAYGSEYYSSFLKSMPVSDCRYAVVEIPGSTRIIFILWTPSGASVKNRMIYASTKETVARTFNGHFRGIQAGELSELEENKIKMLTPEYNRSAS